MPLFGGAAVGVFGALMYLLRCRSDGGWNHLRKVRSDRKLTADGVRWSSLTSYTRSSFYMLPICVATTVIFTVAGIIVIKTS